MASKDEKKEASSSSSSRSRGGIRTLSDLNRASSDDSDSDHPQEYYTGGHKSGMLVRDPTKRNDVNSIFAQARELGALQAPFLAPSPSPSASTSTSFSGTGRFLSGEPVAPSAPPQQQQQQQQPQVVVHNIVFWTNGFTVDDGPLRSLDDPEQASFLESIKKSECPKELEPADRRTPVNVNLIRRDEKYQEPEKAHVPFQGQGRTLGGSDTPPVSVVSAPSTSLNAAPSPSMGLAVVRDLPSTSIQLRLADGTRMIAHFNFHHTVRDIRSFIDASRPGGSRNYNLQTVGFPPKILADPNQTIEQADLANSVIIQKL